MTKNPQYLDLSSSINNVNIEIELQNKILAKKKEDSATILKEKENE